jgi:cytidine deaminase
MTDVQTIELTPAIREKMIAEALEAQASAYCPYSNFAVGAAVLTCNGLIFRGCNVENASYGLTICAERNAIAAAVSAGQLNLIAVVVVTNSPKPARPCGACRQVISEFSIADSPTIIVSISKTGEGVEENINTLLPAQFNLL